MYRHAFRDLKSNSANQFNNNGVKRPATDNSIATNRATQQLRYTRFLDDMLAADELQRCMIIEKTVTLRCKAMASYIHTYGLINKKQTFSATQTWVSQLSYEQPPNIHPEKKRKDSDQNKQYAKNKCRLEREIMYNTVHAH